MLDLKPVEISDKPWVDSIVFAEDSLSADYNFGNMFLWDLTYNQHIGRMGDRLVVKPTYGEPHFFAYPIGTGDLTPVIEAMKADAEESGFPFIIRGVVREHIAQLDEAFPGCFEYSSSRAFFDYIYPAEKLATFSGKKLHGKRNHVNRFIAENDWSYRKLTRGMAPECLEMLSDWENANSERNGGDDGGAEEERLAIERAFEYYDELELEGGALYSGGRLIAFTIGEKISSTGFDVHFEKAYSEVEGAYPMICREFVRQVIANHPEIIYINREDDMGKENLRKAKQSFYPEFLVEKFTAAWKG